MCDNFPAEFLIDYVRVYQASRDSRHTLGCSPASHPTKTYIAAHREQYMDPHDDTVMLDVASGGGACKSQADCGGTELPSATSGPVAADALLRGQCVHNQCRCSPRYTGPHCRAYVAEYDDLPEEPADWLVVFALYTPVTLAVLLAGILAACLLTVQGRYKESEIRGSWRERDPNDPQHHQY